MMPPETELPTLFDYVESIASTMWMLDEAMVRRRPCRGNQKAWTKFRGQPIDKAIADFLAGIRRDCAWILTQPDVGGSHAWTNEKLAKVAILAAEAEELAQIPIEPRKTDA